MTKTQSANLRVPPELAAKLKQLANDDGRSFNSYVVRALEAHVKSQEGKK